MADGGGAGRRSKEVGAEAHESIGSCAPASDAVGHRRATRTHRLD